MPATSLRPVRAYIAFVYTAGYVGSRSIDFPNPAPAVFLAAANERTTYVCCRSYATVTIACDFRASNGSRVIVARSHSRSRVVVVATTLPSMYKLRYPFLSVPFLLQEHVSGTRFHLLSLTRLL